MMGMFLMVWFLTSLRSLQDDSLSRYPYEELRFARYNKQIKVTQTTLKILVLFVAIYLSQKIEY
ncbi:hypothetical protein LMG7974_00718 [Campylobacter majalis]|uniref:Uncharacterized protein n=1 Tax=Campylobacter majalis TaxID=2790656 RepID=A0ABM8Q4U7_9BACT|nr:hypothetical protein [Campylobacter majalis]CAD7287830.1 hypothetical protein LMG7974_00718 [Campylobacter majalis]